MVSHAAEYADYEYRYRELFGRWRGTHHARLGGGEYGGVYRGRHQSRFTAIRRACPCRFCTASEQSSGVSYQQLGYRRIDWAVYATRRPCVVECARSDRAACHVATHSSGECRRAKHCRVFAQRAGVYTRNQF